MLFSSYIFIGVFLPVTLIVYRLLCLTRHPRLPFLWLVVASFFFYGWWNPIHVPLLMASIVANYLIGLRLTALASQSRLAVGQPRLAVGQPQSANVAWKKRRLLIAGIAGNLLVLAYFKYSVFIAENVGALTGLDFGIRAIALPLGISFFTFQKVAYLADAAEGKAAEYRFLDYCLFVTFFPQLIAGPIVHHSQMMPQFRRPEAMRFSNADLALGLTFFIAGLWKKVVLADTMAAYASPVFAAAGEQGLSAWDAWTGALAYSLQLYFDFSGYSDMAIGLGVLFGIRLPFNFNSPYKAVNIIDFWRRWHMTLSKFLRDYLYVPLGGNRKGRARRYLNLFLTMLLGGLWHGAAWTFVIWGMLHGVFLIVNHGWRALMAQTRAGSTETVAGRWIARGLTFLCVMVAWVFFRAESLGDAMSMLSAMAGMNGWTAGLPAITDFHEYREQILILALLAVTFLAPNTQEWIMGEGRANTGSLVPRWRFTPLWAGVAAACFLFTLTQLSAVSEFIYFNF
jgi:alginate O-acetyltransferase complex protein AlgI